MPKKPNKILKKSLPNVKQTLQDFDKKLLVSALKRRYAYLDEYSGKRSLKKKDIKKILDAILAQVQDIKPKTNGKYVLMPTHALEQDIDHDNMFEVYTTSCLYKTKDLQHYADCNQGKKDIFEWDPTNPAVIGGYAYEFVEWPTILGYLVYIPNQFSNIEVADFIADILWEMTFFGIEQAEQEKNANKTMDELEARIEETKDSDNLKTVNSKELAQKFGLEEYYKKKYPTQDWRNWRENMFKIYDMLNHTLIKETLENLYELNKITKKQ